MAQTRHATGNSRPRVFASVETTSANPRARKTTGTKAGATQRKRTTAASKKTASGAGKGAIKKRAPNTHHKRKPGLKDKVAGAIEKVVGKIEGKPGKVGAGTKKMRGTDGKGSRTAVKK